MIKGSSFRRLLLTSGFLGLLLALAVTIPVVVEWLLDSGPAPTSAQNSLLACLFLPTFADWPSHILSYMLAAIVVVGLLLGSGSLFKQWFRTRRTIRALYSLQSSNTVAVPGWHRLLSALKLDGRVDLIEARNPIAFCHGWVRPRICISTGAVARLSESEIKALLLHERHHLLRRDPLKTAVSRVLVSAFFFLPVIRALQNQYLVAKEIEADEYVLRSQGSNRPLLSALYKMLLQQTNDQPSGVSGLVAAGSTDEVNQRLDHLLNGQAPSGIRLPVLFASSAMIAIIVAIMVIATWSSAAAALWNPAHVSVGVC